MQGVLQADEWLFRVVNAHHAPWLDWPLWVASQHWSWIVVVLAMGGMAMWDCGARSLRRGWWVYPIAVALCFLLADRLSVWCFKEVFCRPRPCHTLEGVHMFRTRCGGAYGFVSSHAANAAAVVLLTSLVLRRYRLKFHVNHTRLYAALAWLWCGVVCYSRVYLGKHYPGDVIGGALLGVAIGALCYAIWLRITDRVEA